MSKLKLLLVVACIVVISSTQFVFAESAGNQLRLASKGRVSVTSHFPGLIVWTNIKGQDASFLVRTEDGLLRVTAVLAESDQCEQENRSLCFEGSIKSLKNNIAFIVFFIHIMNRYSRFFYVRSNNFSLNIYPEHSLAAKLRQQGRMDVDYFFRECADYFFRDKPEKTCKHNERWIFLMKKIQNDI